MNIIWWISFNIIVLGCIYIDLYVINRNKIYSLKEAKLWSGIWIGISLLFNAFIYWQFGKEKALEFTAGYLIEKSLSIDNVFVFYLIFNHFKIPTSYQHRILSFGIIGAILMRSAMIFSGIWLIEHFHFLMYIFGVLLIYLGVKIAQNQEFEATEENLIIKVIKKYCPFTPHLAEGKFWVKERIENKEKIIFTPLMLALITIEITDLIFAIDSIPAVFAITLDPFIVYTSNILAILGLRALYFLFAISTQKFVYLKYGLSVIIIFVGLKMLLSGFYKFPVVLSLLFIMSVLATTIVASVFSNKKKML